MAQRLKHLHGIQETWVRSLGREDPLEKEMATHSSTLAWRIPWREEPGRLQSLGSQRVGHDWTTSLSLSDFHQKAADLQRDLYTDDPYWCCCRQVTGLLHGRLDFIKSLAIFLDFPILDSHPFFVENNQTFIRLLTTTNCNWSMSPSTVQKV